MLLLIKEYLEDDKHLYVRLYEDSVIDYLNTLLTHCRATCCKRRTTDIGMLNCNHKVEK